LESIVVPNAQIAEGFQSQLVTLKSGEMQVGIVKEENATELTLQTFVPGAPPLMVKKTELQSRENAPSGMPAGMGDLLTRREIRDIIEFLATLRD
jgi:putative heme-binding domain-containing protein